MTEPAAQHLSPGYDSRLGYDTSPEARKRRHETALKAFEELAAEIGIDEEEYRLARERHKEVEEKYGKNPPI